MSVTRANELAGASGLPGGLIPLAELVAASSASLDFTVRNVGSQSGPIFQADFDDYVIEIINMLAASAGTLNLRTGSGSIDSGANYRRTGWYNGNADAFAGVNNAGGQTNFGLCNIRSAVNSLTANGTIQFFGPRNTAATKQMMSLVTASAIADSNLYMFQFAGSWDSLLAADRVQLYCDSGNIASGTARVYGVAKTAGSGPPGPQGPQGAPGNPAAMIYLSTIAR